MEPVADPGPGWFSGVIGFVAPSSSPLGPEFKRGRPLPPRDPPPLICHGDANWWSWANVGGQTGSQLVKIDTRMTAQVNNVISYLSLISSPANVRKLLKVEFDQKC